MRLPLPPQTRYALNQQCEPDRRSIRPPSCTWYFNWRTETGVRKLEKRVMRTMNWIVLALMVVTMPAVAQQAGYAPPNTQPVSASQSAPSQPTVQSLPAPPTTINQVIERVVEREKQLIK